MPLAAFSMMALETEGLAHWHSEGSRRDRGYRSMTVMAGHVKAPAVAALAMSTPKRVPSCRVFQLERAGTTGASKAFCGMLLGNQIKTV